jgi:hypothetical protein
MAQSTRLGKLKSMNSHRPPTLQGKKGEEKSATAGREAGDRNKQPWLLLPTATPTKQPPLGMTRTRPLSQKNREESHALAPPEKEDGLTLDAPGQKTAEAHPPNPSSEPSNKT